MFGSQKTDVVVLGAGPVGLAAAHTLVDEDIPFVLLDRERCTGTHSYALALHPETMELLESFGVASHALRNARKLPKVAFYEGAQRKCELNYSKLSSPYPYLAVLPQSDLEEALERGLQDKGSKVHWDHRVRFIEREGEHSRLVVDRLQDAMVGYAVARIEKEVDSVVKFDTRYIIGADGHNSLARRVADIDFAEVAPTTEYAVFEFQTDVDLPDEMRLITTDEGAHVFWPLPDGSCRWSFQVKPDSVSASRKRDTLLVTLGNEGYPLLEEDRLREWLATIAPWFEGKVEHLRWRMMVKFEQRLAKSFGQRNIWLAGDSAHMAPPAGVLSMNVGMREARDLAQHMACLLRGGKADSLANFSEKRIAQWRALLNLDGALRPQSDTDPWVVAQLPKISGNIPASGESLKTLAAQIGLFVQ